MDGLTKLHPSMIDGLLTNLIVLERSAVGAVPLTLQQWLNSQPISVVEFGAKGGDGIGDNVPIQAAMDAVYAAGGGCVLVPPGGYQLSAGLVMRSGVSLVALGRGAVTFTATTHLPSMVLIDSKSDVTISGIKFVGSWYASPSDGNYGGIYISNASTRVTVEHCQFRDLRGNGVDLNVGNSFCDVRRNYFENCRVGVSVFKGNSDCWVESNGLKQIREIGINVDDATSVDTEATASPNNRITVADNHLFEIGSAPGAAAIACQGSAYVTVKDNHIHRSGRAAGVAANGIVVNGGQAEHNPSLYVAVDGNHISEGTAEAVVVRASRGVSVTNNQINDNWQWPSALSGVLPEVHIAPGTSTVTTGILIDGNQIAHNGTPTGRANYAVSSSSSDNTDIQIGTNHLRGFSVDQQYGGYNLQLLFQGHQSLATLPAVAHRGRLVHNQTDDKFYGGTATGWVVVGSQS